MSLSSCVFSLSASDINMTVGLSSFKASLISLILFVIPLAQFQLQTVKGKVFFLEWVLYEGSVFIDCLSTLVVEVVAEIVVEEFGSKSERAVVDFD